MTHIDDLSAALQQLDVQAAAGASLVCVSAVSSQALVIVAQLPDVARHTSHQRWGLGLVSGMTGPLTGPLNYLFLPAGLTSSDLREWVSE